MTSTSEKSGRLSLIKLSRIFPVRKKSPGKTGIYNHVEAEKTEAGISPVISVNPYLDVYIDEERNILIQKWRGFCPGEKFRTAIDTVLMLMSENNIHRTISDVREQRVVSPENQSYAGKRIMNSIDREGPIKMAFIFEEKSVVSFCVKAADRMIREKYGYSNNGFFTDFENAEKWLLKD